ncbi:response regulator [Massilia sp. TN1-12]|uniref:response regulator n=1 Tax=Massilia paldalensis TaxID=3377675 RepID=UPI00384E097A
MHHPNVLPSSGAPIRVLVADDHPLMLDGIATALERQGGFEIVTRLHDGEAAIEAWERARPDVGLIDLQMPIKDGIETIRTIRSLDPGARLVVLTTYRGDARIAMALKAGARAYLGKNAGGDELARTVRDVHEGRYVLPQALRQEVTRHYAGDALSPRELDVLRLAARGRSNREIAALLGIGEATVKTHMSTMLVKLGASDRTHAVTLAAQRGFIDF